MHKTSCIDNDVNKSLQWVMLNATEAIPNVVKTWAMVQNAPI